ncbi:MAG TPA: monovalent cation/H(+) antiporter subunit G [Blastocatellia bacterium]|nr:monovalent cation/H(+) antiporter subunit G [Blastocatellia bacterium]
MSEAVTVALMIIGALFLLLAGVGVIRMPDLFMRMQAATKASTLGVGCTLVAVMVYFGSFGVAIRALLVIAFLLLTAPVAAHMIGRAAYFVGVPLWEGTIRDELRGRYDAGTHTLAGHSRDPYGDERIRQDLQD